MLRHCLLLVLLSSGLGLGAAEHPYAFERPEDPSKFSFSQSFQPRVGGAAAAATPVKEQSRTTNWFHDMDRDGPTIEIKSVKSGGNVSTTTKSPINQNGKKVVKKAELQSEYEEDEEDYYEEDDKYVFRQQQQQQQQPKQQQQQQQKHQRQPQRPQPKAVPVAARRNFGPNLPSRSNSAVATERRGAAYRSKKGEDETAAVTEAAAKDSEDYYEDDEYYQEEGASLDERRRDGSHGGGHGGGSGYGGGGGGLNPLALLVAPLAGIALLSAAAAVALNPFMISISVSGKKRRRRDDGGNDIPQSGYLTSDMEEKLEEMKVLEDYLGQMPKNDSYQQRMLSMYLTCSGYTDTDNLCLDRVVCEFSSPSSALRKEDKDVISIILYHIMGNVHVGDSYKERLRRAAKAGRDTKGADKCPSNYPCRMLDQTLS